MPKYHCKGIEVRLCTWALVGNTALSQRPKTASSVAAITESSRGFESARQCTDLNHTPLPKTGNMYICPADGSERESLNEEYFQNHRGLLFMDDESPFYLVQVFDLSSDNSANESKELNDEATLAFNWNEILYPDSSIDRSLGVPGMSSEPRATLKPFTISVKLQEKSFMQPLTGDIGHRHDICISIFYNGELSNSRVVKYGPSWTQGYKERHSFGGRRSETSLETPWVISTQGPLTGGHNIRGSEVVTAMSASQRWAKLSELLLSEADEWGRLGSGSRSVVGNYLEFLSKQAMPIEIDGTADGGKDYGVIDVIVAYGRSSSYSPVILTSPSRRLPRGIRNSKDSGSIVGSARNLSVDQTVPISVKPMSTNFIMELSKREVRDLLNEPKIIPVPPRPLPYEMPRNIPQKRYRGPSPEPAESPDLDTTPAMSTRSRAPLGQPSFSLIAKDQLVRKQKVLPKATTGKARLRAISSTSVKHKFEMKQSFAAQTHAKVNISPSGVGSVAVQPNESAFETPEQGRRERKPVGAREMKELFTLPLPSAMLDSPLGRTRRATQDSKELLSAQVQNRPISAPKKRASGARRKKTIASDIALRDETSSLVPGPIPKKLKLNLRVNAGANQSRDHLSEEIGLQLTRMPRFSTVIRKRVNAVQGIAPGGASTRATSAARRPQVNVKGRLRLVNVPKPQESAEAALTAGMSADATDAVNEPEELISSAALPGCAPQGRKILRMRTSTANNEVADASPHERKEQEESGFSMGNGNTSASPITINSPAKKTWEPNVLCDGSILTYMSHDDFSNVKKETAHGLAYRPMPEEHDMSFETYGILLGTRFVVCRKNG